MSFLSELPLVLRLFAMWLAVSAVVSPLVGRFLAEGAAGYVGKVGR